MDTAKPATAAKLTAVAQRAIFLFMTHVGYVNDDKVNELFFNFRVAFATIGVETDAMTEIKPKEPCQTHELTGQLAGMRGKLLAIARRFMKVSGLVVDEEDIVQEALAELWTLFESGYQIRNVEALAVKITKTVCVRHYRERRIPMASIEVEGMVYAGGPEASESIDLQEVLEIRNKLFAQLSDTQKRYLEMRHERDMSLDEIAAETGRPKASIKATISQARKIMYEQLKKMSE